MKIGISSPAFSNMQFEPLLEKVAEHFTIWEIVADIEQFLPDIKDHIIKLAPSYDIKFSIHAPFNDLNIASFNKHIREYSMRTIKESMTVAHELGIRGFSLHPGHFCAAGLYDHEKVHRLSKQGVKELAEFSSDLDLDVSLENMPIPNWTLCTTRDELMEYIELSGFRICFDIGHAHINGQIFEFMKVKEHFGNIHIHDNNGKRDEHTIIGEGSIPFRDFIPELAESYSGNIIIEANNLEEGIISYNKLRSMTEP